jgi:N-acetylmuramoyl-L-alanine amidase
MKSNVTWAICVMAVLFPGTRSIAQVSTGGDESMLADQLARITSIQGDMGQTLLPRGSTIERLSWEQGLLRLEISVPSGAIPWHTNLTDMERISHEFVGALMDRDAFRGVDIRIRDGHRGPFKPLESFAVKSVPATQPNSAPSAAEVRAAQESAARFAAVSPELRGGPTANSPSQPAGALSGVVVFCSAGHGWTAGTDAWLLQRPGELEGMNEDYGNLDQLNYFVHHAFNAGATVVPFRPVGYQNEEIVIDNADAAVTYTGTWTANSSNAKYYGHNASDRYRFASANPTETATARYTANITSTGFYPVYCFTIASTNRVPQTYRVKHSGGISEIVIDHRDVGNGWIWLGEYYLVAGDGAYVEISNASSVAGVVVADAIRWGNGIGDVIGTSQNSVSGYPRHEEAQRYWAASELGDKANGFTAGDIWDSSGADQSDNVSTGSRWAREMNQVPVGGVLADRWKRIYLEFHTNAFNGAARGTVALESTSSPTANQNAYAAFISDEVENDMILATTTDNPFEHVWSDRVGSVVAGEYGAISTIGNSDEFDATILEVAFHDNQTDAELLRDARVRAAVARASVQGMIRFLNSLPGSPVPLVFPPDRPQAVQVSDLGDASVLLNWEPPVVGEVEGGSPTDYVVYSSTNGFGFTIETVIAGGGGTPATTVTLGGISRNETMFYRIAARNEGGESQPSSVVSVRRPPNGDADILIVNGYDRLRRHQNPVTLFTQPPAYAGLAPERPLWRHINSFDYVSEFGGAIAAAGRGFDSCENEAVELGLVNLEDYEIVMWNSGAESIEDTTLSAAEQTELSDYLDAGGGLFISGSDLALDLVNQGAGANFAETRLTMLFAADDAGTFNVNTAAGGIFSALSSFDFDPDAGARYEVYEPDVLGISLGGDAALTYSAGGIAGIQHDSQSYRTVTFGFPFETISSETVRAEVMAEVIAFLDGATASLPFDADGDGDVDLTDFQVMNVCLAGPTITFPEGNFCLVVDGDANRIIDLRDFHLFLQYFTGSLP